MLVFSNDLKPVLQWDIHIRRDRPLRVKQRGRIFRFVPVVSSTGGHIVTERVATIHECTLAVEMFQCWNGWKRTSIDRDGIASVLQSPLRQEVFPDGVGRIERDAIKVVAKRGGRGEIKINVTCGAERCGSRSSCHAADLACTCISLSDRRAIGAVSWRCNVPAMVDERDPAALRMQYVGGIRREVGRAVAWRIEGLGQCRRSLVGSFPRPGLRREWQKTVRLLLPSNQGSV